MIIGNMFMVSMGERHEKNQLFAHIIFTNYKSAGQIMGYGIVSFIT